MTRHGATMHRALAQDHVSKSAFANPGVFGRMFPTLPTFEFTKEMLEALNTKMKEDSEAAGGGLENLTVAAGYTFLGQFIDHDITFDPTSSLEKQSDPEAIHNFRTPLLELDNVYGSGPDASPYLYDQRAGFEGMLLIGSDDDGNPNDLPRNRQGTALIGDPRNDENIVVSQLHLAFLKFHNSIMGDLKDTILDPGDRFAEAQRIVRWHYQWLVVNEFLPRIVSQKLVDDILGRNGGEGAAGITGQDPIGNILDKLKSFRWKEEPFIPVEFAVAAYRFGHSMVRTAYIVNRIPQGAAPVFAGPFFPTLSVPPNLTADKVLNSKRRVDWKNFFEMEETTTPPQQELPEGAPQRSFQMDTRLSPSLFTLPIPDVVSAQPDSLALRNLKRGVTFQLPWGQAVAYAMGIEPLSDEELGLTAIGFPPQRAPLWYYILKEAEIKNQGHFLGPVGGNIVAQVLIGLLIGDQNSYLSQNPLWKPILGRKKDTFTVSDLLRLAGVDAAPTEAAEPPPPPQRTYTVQQNDTLRSIAKKLLGSEMRWQEIFIANRDTIRNPDLIRSGQELVIPNQ